MLVSQFIWWLSVRPVQCHRLNWCYCFCIHLSNSSWRSFGHLKNILSLLFTMVWVSQRWIGHIEFYPWDLKKSYKCDLTNLLVLLIMLSYNHQNHKQWPNEIMFLTSVMWDDAANSTHAVAKVTSLISTTYFWHSPTMEWVALDMTN